MCGHGVPFHHLITFHSITLRAPFRSTSPLDVRVVVTSRHRPFVPSHSAQSDDDALLPHLPSIPSLYALRCSRASLPPSAARSLVLGMAIGMVVGMVVVVVVVVVVSSLPPRPSPARALGTERERARARGRGNMGATRDGGTPRGATNGVRRRTNAAFIAPSPAPSRRATARFWPVRRADGIAMVVVPPRGRCRVHPRAAASARARRCRSGSGSRCHV